MERTWAKKVEPYWTTSDGETVRLYRGDTRAVLRSLPERSVQCVVTSPPYWGLRDYGTGKWVGGKEDCDHLAPAAHGYDSTAKSTLGPGGKGLPHTNSAHSDKVKRQQYKDVCGKCGARRVDQQIGAEPSPDCGTQGQAQCGGCFVCSLVSVFREVRRVLRDDGTCWLNLGDSYSGGKTGRADDGSGDPTSRLGPKRDGLPNNSGAGPVKQRPPVPGIPSGNLIGVPWRVALALQSDGWVLRQDILWHKPAPMPECLDPQTKVFIRTNGWVSRSTLARVYAMKVKPEVLGPNGWVKIINIWSTVKPAMLIEAGKVERVICSPDHKFPVSHDRDNLATEDKLVTDIRATGYRDYLLYHPIDKHLSPTLSSWEGIGLTGHLGYVLGLYAAEGSQDGGYRMKWTIHVKENYIKHKFYKSLQSLGLKGQSFPDPNGNAQNLVATSEWLQRTIQTFVLGKDARTKRLNVELLLNSPEDFRRRLLEGYIDGDGSYRGDGWGASSASRDLRDDLSTLASSLGIITSKGYSKTQLAGRDKDYHSHSLWTPYFNRSTKKGAEGTYQVLPRGRKNLDGEREMIDMEVEGGLFLIGDGLVTHNSVRNRCTKAHEYVFLLTKSMRYYYDAEVIKEKADTSDLPPRTLAPKQASTEYDGMISHNENHASAVLGRVSHRNKRSVWTVSSQGYPGAHFATFPGKLIEPMIKAGTSERGCCSACGAPWKRVVEEKALTRERPNEYVKRTGEEGTGNSCPNTVAGVETKTVGWEPTCECESEVAPCTVLDPFIGSGTTCDVSIGLGRRSVGIDLSEEYLRDNAIIRIEGALLSRPATAHLAGKKRKPIQW